MTHGRAARGGFLVSCGAILVAAACGCDRARDADAAEVVRPDVAVDGVPAPEPPWVPVADTEAIARTLALPSHLMVERNVGVTARRDGIIEEIRAERGDRVVEDQVLAVLERGDLLVSERAAALERDTENASFERARRLLEQKIIADEEFEQIRLRRNAAEESLDRIRYELSKCFVRAPFEGVVSGRFVEKGQFVRWDDGQVLYQVTALRPLLARVYVPEWALPALHPGQPAAIIATGSRQGRGPHPGDGIAARVKWINHVVDAASSTAELLVEVTGTEDSPHLRPGLSVEVSIPLTFRGAGRDGRLLSLPRETIEPDAARDGGGATLRVLQEDGTIATRAVVLGIVGDDRVEIREGLDAGDRVVLPR